MLFIINYVVYIMETKINCKVYAGELPPLQCKKKIKIKIDTLKSV